MKPESRLWLNKAEGHLKAAGVLREAGLYSQCVFFCQQAVEVLLKAMWVERAPNNTPPRTHDLVFLAERLELGLAQGQLEFLRRLGEQYTPARYGDIELEYSSESAKEYHDGATEVFAWLRPRLS
jgi:HEPN domain-containing protein